LIFSGSPTTVSLPFLVFIAIGLFWNPLPWFYANAIPLLFLVPVYRAFAQETGALGRDARRGNLTVFDIKAINAFAQNQSKAADQAKLWVLAIALTSFWVMNVSLGWDNFYANLPASCIAVGPGLLIAVFGIQHIADMGTRSHQNSIIAQAELRAGAVRSVRNTAIYAGRVVDDQGVVHRLL